MAIISRYKADFRADNLGTDPKSATRNIPKLSQQLDSIRAYNFEIRIRNAPISRSYATDDVVLAAKKVTSSGHKVETIPVRRLNDTYYYPGGADSDELTITFDHLLKADAIAGVYSWFQNGAYNPATGIVAGAERAKSTIMDVLYLDNARNVLKVVTYYGIFPTSFKPSEANYSTNNEFHTFEVTFRYDFMTYFAEPESVAAGLRAFGNALEAVGQILSQDG